MTYALRRLFMLATIGVALDAGSGPTAFAQSAYDGIWSVVIVTEKGECDRAYRYPLSIRRGVVTHGPGVDRSFTIKGRVGSGGSVNVTISRGQQSARGTGRLRGESGSGRWTSANKCTGYWNAEKRPDPDEDD